MTFFVQHFLGLAGMPRRIPDYALQFADFNAISSVGAFGFGISQLLFVYVVVDCIRAGQKTSERHVWEGADTLDWELPTPLPYHSFHTRRRSSGTVTSPSWRTAATDGAPGGAGAAMKPKHWTALALAGVVSVMFVLTLLYFRV